ncbi:MAG: UbiA family prenyltransferase [Bacteroidia bacterium]
MGNYLSIFRPLNILFIALAQGLCAYFLDFSADLTSILEGGVHWLVIGTAASAGFGYWVNDFFDQERDFINSQKSSPISSIDNNLVIIHLLAFISIALYAGNMLGVWFVLLFSFSIIFLFLYAKWLKNVALLGNIIVATLCFFSLYSTYVLFSDIDFLLILHFSILASFVTLAREMVKDAEDIEGDQATGAKTIPILMGTKILNIAVYLVILFCLTFMVTSLMSQKEYLSTPLNYVYYVYCGLFILLPLYKSAVDVRYAKDKTEYTRLSLWLKYVLFVGVLSILFF